MRTLGVIALVALVGLFVWAIALFSIGTSGEDVCLNGMTADRGGSISSVSLFPPRYECRYQLADGSTDVVSHPIRAWTSFATRRTLPACLPHRSIDPLENLDEARAVPRYSHGPPTSSVGAAVSSRLLGAGRLQRVLRSGPELRIAQGLPRWPPDHTLAR